MKLFRKRPHSIALLTLTVVLAACKGESPTAPPPVPGPGTPSTPPVGAVVNVTVSNPNPTVNLSTTITATVTINNQPAPAGTAVEFTTTLGRFEDTGGLSSLRTTNAQGQASVVLTSTTPGTATVTVVVNNVVQRVTVTFGLGQQPPPAPDAPTITGVNPQFGPVEGGTTVSISGTNFIEPVRVFFDLGSGNLREAIVTSVTPTLIQVLTPRIDLPAGQTLPTSIVVVTRAGTADERRVTSAAQFTFRRTQLTPVVSTVSPSSGPLEGGTRVTLFGDGFEPFVQVFFGLAEAQIVNVTFNEITVITPNSRDTTANSTPVAGQVPVRVVNVNSRTQVTLSDGFRYASAMQIVAIGPTEGPFTGGTRVRIDGVGFDDPVAVTIGGVGAQVISVAGTQIVAQTSPVTVTGCSDVEGPISVTNINTGESVLSDVTFTYRVPQPIIVSVSNPTVVGGSISIRVFNAFGFPRLRLDNTALTITGETLNADGTTTFTATVPTTLQLQTQACPAVGGVNAQQPTAFDVTYESATTGCTDTAPDAATIVPPNAPILRFDPIALTPFTTRINAGNPTAVPPVPPSVPPSAPQTVSIVNAGQAPLTVTAITTTGAGCASFTVAAPPTPQTLGTCESLPIIVQYNGSIPAGTQSCTLTVTTDAGTRSFNLIGTTTN